MSERDLDDLTPEPIERCVVVYESVKKTIIHVPAGKKGGPPREVRVNAAGVFACMGGKCFPPTDCEHVREARAFFIAQGAEPAIIPPRPYPTEGAGRQR